MVLNFFLLILNLQENRTNMLDTSYDIQHRRKITLFLRKLRNNHCFFKKENK